MQYEDLFGPGKESRQVFNDLLASIETLKQQVEELKTEIIILKDTK